MEKAEIVIYKQDDVSDFQIEVRIENETVWLNRQQLALLFDRDVKTIGKHVANALKEELRSFPVIAKFATTATDGKVYQVEYYNLDMIISIGYRVKSYRGIQFRMWANKILKEYFLKGYVINHRLEKVENEVNSLNARVNEVEFQLKSNLLPSEGIFFDGQIYDAWLFVLEIIKDADRSIILIDNYIDENVLALFAKRKPGVNVRIFTAKIPDHLALDIKKHNIQYPSIEVETFTRSHDRFLIIDEKTIYHIGASLKDLGKKWFAFSKMNLDIKDLLSKMKD